MKNKLSRLLLSKWIAETVYFVGLVFIAGTALLFLLNHYLRIGYDIIHVIALVLLFAYVIIGLFVSNKSEKIGVSKTFFKIVISFGYLAIVSYFKGVFFDYITHPYIAAIFALFFAISIFYLSRYNKLIFKEVFRGQTGINFQINDNDPENIKSGAIMAIKERIKRKWEGKVVVEGVSLYEDRGTIITLFNLNLNNRLLGVPKPRLMRITLKFSIPEEG